MPVKSFIAEQISLFTQKILCGLIALSRLADISTLLRHFFFMLRPEHKMMSIKSFVYTDLQV